MRRLIVVFTLIMLALSSSTRTAIINMTPTINSAYVRTNTDTLRIDGYSDTLGILGADYVNSVLKTVIWADTVWVWLQASLDGTNWVNTDADNDSMFITGTGMSSIIYPYTPSFRFYRLKFNFETADSTTKILPFFKVGS